MTDHPADCPCIHCRKTLVESSGRADYLREKVEAHGWAAVGVFRAQESDPPPATYTIGFSKRFPGCPEFLVSGPEPALAHFVFVALFDNMVEGNTHWGALDFKYSVLEDYEVRFLPIKQATADDFCGIATKVLGFRPEYVQMVFPDKQHRWPWEDGYSSADQTAFGEFPA